MNNKIQPRTTIDNLHIEAHRRYAKDQKELDPRFIVDASAVSSHAELAGTSVIYSSQLEQLIETLIGTLPWASFQAPHGYLMQSNRFFRSALFPKTKQTFQEENEKQKKNQDEQEDEEEEQHPLVECLKRKLSTLLQDPPLGQNERDQGTLLSLAEEISRIDALLAHITARKLQYQKG